MWSLWLLPSVWLFGFAVYCTVLYMVEMTIKATWTWTTKQHYHVIWTHCWNRPTKLMCLNHSVSRSETDQDASIDLRLCETKQCILNSHLIKCHRSEVKQKPCYTLFNVMLSWDYNIVWMIKPQDWSTRRVKLTCLLWRSESFAHICSDV